ncbi:hypothetical protein Vafri_11417 [Volvox africanus]|nr:hypothetical protein Vafri_11417 [Volvox africanus]
MYETQGAGDLLSLEQVRTAAAAATGPLGLASRSQPCCSRKSTLITANHHPATLASGFGPASAPPCILRPASSCLQRQSQHQHQQRLHDAPMSPRRNDLTAGPPPPSTRSTGNGALAMASVRPVLSVLKVLLPGSSGDLDEDVNAGDGFCSGLPSMVPDDQPRVQHSSSSARIRKALGSAQASLEQLPLHASSSLGGLRRLDSGTEIILGLQTPSGVMRERDPSLHPSTPSSSISRGLRSCSVMTSPQAPYPLAPQPPLHPYHSGMVAPDSIVAPAARLSGAESPLKSSYKTQMRRLHVAGLALGGVDVCNSEGEEGVQEAVRTVPEDDEAQVDEAQDGRFQLLRGPSSEGLEETAPSRRGTQAWGPFGESAPGSLGSRDVLGCWGSVSPSAASKPSPGSAIGFSRRPEDLTAAPCPAQSRSLAGGIGNSAPCTSGSHGLVGVSRMSFAWQPSTASSVGSNSVGSSSVGFSRRLEDLPAAPSPSSSRSLAGGAGGSGGDTPVSPISGMGTTFSVPRTAQQLLTTSPLPPQPKSMHGVTPAAGIAANIGTATSVPIAQQQQQQQQQSLRPAVSAAAAVYGEAALHQPTNASSTTTITITSSTRHGAAPSPAASAAQPPVAPKPLLQRQSSVGFSRRLEDLPAAPSPCNSRSLAGGAGSSASSTQSWCSPRTPPSPAASETAMRSSMLRRVDDLPPAPPPSQSRSLRPESSRAMFRSHASAAAGSNTSACGPWSTVSSQAPPSPLTWRVSNVGGGGGGLLASLGSPPPQPPPYVINGSSSRSRSSGVGVGAGHMQQQMGPQPEMHDIVDLPVVQGGVCEDLSD